MDGPRGAPAEAPHFEHAITLARIGGAVVVVLVAPFLPNLGPGFVGLLAGSLVVAAIVLHVLSTRVRDAGGSVRLSWAAFAFDTLVVFFAILLLTPDPMWPIVPLMAVLLVITTTFRLGTAGAIGSTLLASVGVLAIAAWRDRALGLEAPTAYLAFDLIMYGLTAVIVTSMLREVGVLRRERLALIVRASDADALRASERERAALLEHERQARTAAELAVTRLDAVQRISDIVLRHASADELLPETLRTLAHIVGARAAAILTRDGGGLVARAVFGMEHAPRAPIPLRGDAQRALASDDPTAVRDDSLVPLDALATSYVVARLLVRIGRRAHASLLYLGYDRVQDLTADDRALFGGIGERLATALDRADRLAAEWGARVAAETAAGRAQLLSDAADAILGERDTTTRLARMARLVAPKLADDCTIDLLRPDGTLERVAVASASAEREADLWTVARRYPDASGRGPLRQVLGARAPLLIEHAGPDELAGLARGPEHLRLLIDRDVRSWAGVPIVRDGAVLGALQLIDVGSRSLTPDDVATAQAVALRAASAVDRDGVTMG